MRKYLFIIWLQLFALTGWPQDRLLESPHAMKLAEETLNDLYNYRFVKGRQGILRIEPVLPDHPVVPFLRALILYWENMPLTSSSTDSDRFLAYIDEAILHARSIREVDPDDPEGVFFELLGYAMIMMHYADNGHTSKVIPYLSPAYRLLKKGFVLGREFNEFYFTTGIYNYYIEAYPEAYPVYKPLAALFPRGSKELGLRMLEKVSRESLFLRNEALVFLNHLYLSYENDPARALIYLETLINRYPDNNFFLIRYIKTLIAGGRYEDSMEYIDLLVERGESDDFAHMAGWIYQGIIDEKVHGKKDEARIKYLQGIKFGRKFGEWVNNYMAIGYAGLSRIYAMEGNRKKSREYLKLARSTAKYDFVFNQD
jgi:tetratricopeptide (TPR) repeat protein